MSEELCDELAKLATRYRVKHIGFGRNEAALANSQSRLAVRYTGDGIFVARGINLRRINATNETPTTTRSDALKWAVYDSDLKLLYDPLSGFANTQNEVYDNLDHGIALVPRDYLIVEVIWANATSSIFPGVIWGIEFLFDNGISDG